MNILILCGSSRTGSYNRILMESASACLSEHRIAGFAIEELPFYSSAIDNEQRPPEVSAFLAEVSQADAIVFISPEYNYSIPAVVKNAIDWASRPAFNSPLKGKPVTLLSASPSPNGGNLMQIHLKQVLDAVLAVIYPSINYCLASAHEKIHEGQLVDQPSIERLQRHLHGFVEWSEKITKL